jgi:hypothetical protein
MSADYWNRFTQAEKREELRHDTMFTRQRDALDESGGRFAKINPIKVTGAEPISQVPQQPPNSPWSQPDRNPEPPFGDVNEMEPVGSQPVGSPTEIQRSLERPDADPDNGPSTVAVDCEGQEPVSSSALTETGSPNSQQLRRSPEDVGSGRSIGGLLPRSPSRAFRKRFRRRF